MSEYVLGIDLLRMVGVALDGIKLRLRGLNRLGPLGEDRRALDEERDILRPSQC